MCRKEWILVLMLVGSAAASAQDDVADSVQDDAAVAPDELAGDAPPALLDAPEAPSGDDDSTEEDAAPMDTPRGAAPMDPAGENKEVDEEASDETYSESESSEGWGDDSQQSDDGYDDDETSRAHPRSEATPEDDHEPQTSGQGNDQLTAAGAAYGAGAAVASTYFITQVVSSSLSFLSVLVPTAAGIIQPLYALTSCVGCSMCCALPALEGAAITAAGDFMLGSDPGMAYLWTILASYGACYSGGFVLGVAQLLAVLVIVGLTGGGVIRNQDILPAFSTPLGAGLAATSGVGLTLLFVGVQPLVPAGVWYLTAQPPSGASGRGGDEDHFDENSRRAPQRRRRQSKELGPRAPDTARWVMAF